MNEDEASAILADYIEGQYNCHCGEPCGPTPDAYDAATAALVRLQKIIRDLKAANG